MNPALEYGLVSMALAQVKREQSVCLMVEETFYKSLIKELVRQELKLGQELSVIFEG
jgi:hypothetical protein